MFLGLTSQLELWKFRKTVIARLVLWLVGWVWIGRILILLGVVCFGLYYTHAKWGDLSARSEEALFIR